MTICGWTIERGNRSLNAEWIARLEEDPVITCWLSNRTLHVSEDRQYYPGGGYEIPLAVIEALQSREPR